MATETLLDITPQMGLLERVFTRLTANTKRRALRNSLLKMDDHMLRDIGLSRHKVLSDEF